MGPKPAKEEVEGTAGAPSLLVLQLVTPLIVVQEDEVEPGPDVTALVDVDPEPASSGRASAKQHNPSPVSSSWSWLHRCFLQGKYAANPSCATPGC